MGDLLISHRKTETNAVRTTQTREQIAVATSETDSHHPSFKRSTNQQIDYDSPQMESLIALMSSPVQLQHAIRYLRQVSLVGYKSTEDTSALRIHDLIQIMIQESCRRDGRQYHWFRVATVLACDAFRHVEDPFSHRCWAQCEIIVLLGNFHSMCSLLN